MIRKAEKDDIPQIAEIYSHIHDACETGRLHTGWIRDVYPTEKTALASLGRGDLYVSERDGRVVAAAVINRTQVDCYAECDWSFEAKDDEVLVLHTLTVEPSMLHCGLGSEFVSFYENLARAEKCRVLRMDTNEINSAARALYEKLGYRQAGIVPCEFNGIPDVMLVCLEKLL